jgi:hypothetical protein
MDAPLCSDGTREHLWLDQQTGDTTMLRLVQKCAVCGASRLVFRDDGRDVTRYGRAPKEIPTLIIGKGQWR